ncbi:retrotransposon protein, putative, ty1-copia subclass [Tanacetum coccineum]
MLSSLQLAFSIWFQPDGEALMKIWHGKAPKLSYLRVWGCEALVKRDAPDKLDPRSIKCIFVGYPKETMGYYFYYPPENKIFVARNAEFFEDNLIVQEASRSYGPLIMSGSDKGVKLIQEEDTQPSENTSKEHNEVVPIEVEPQNVKVPIRRSARIPQAPDRYGFYVDVDEYELGDLNEPPNYKAALSDPEYDKWLEAMNTEMQSIKDNQVWILVVLPPNGVFSKILVRFTGLLLEIYSYVFEDLLKDMVLMYGAKPEAKLKVSSVDRKSAKQSTTAMYSIEAKYIVAAEASR